MACVVALFGTPRASADTPLLCPGGGACVAVSVWTATNSAANPPTPTIISAARLAQFPAPSSATYAVQRSCPTPGQPNSTCASSDVYPHPVSIPEIIRYIGALSDPAFTTGDVTYTAATGTNGYRSTLTTADLTGPPSPFAGGVLEPAIYVLGDETGYLRPLRTATDLNYQDSLLYPSGMALPLAIHTSGTVLSPTVTASKSTIKTGEQVTVTASVDDPVSTNISYKWTYAGADSHPRISGNTITLTYSTPGRWGVSVVVTDDAGSYGQSQNALVSVAAKQTAPSTKPPSSTPPSGSGPGGGSSSGSSTGPASGSGSNSTGPTGSHSAGPTTSGSSTPAPSRSATANATPSPSATPSMSATQGTSMPPATSSAARAANTLPPGAATGHDVPVTSTDSPTSASTDPTHVTNPLAGPAGAGPELVHGIVIDAGGAVPGHRAVQTDQTSTGGPAAPVAVSSIDRTNTAGGIGAGVVAILAIAALLGLGALRESRRGTRRGRRGHSS